MFTANELHELNREKLLRLCKYFGLKTKSKMKREDIIDIILKHLYPVVSECVIDDSGEIVPEQQKSIRVRRIEEFNRND